MLFRRALYIACLLVASQVSAQDAYPVNVVGELINFETPLIKPIITTADGRYVVVAHEADQRVLVLSTQNLETIAEIPAGLGLTALAERPGGKEIWVSAAFSSAVLVIDMETFSITHALAPQVDDRIGDRATPGGIAFSEDGAKAWVVGTTTDVLNVYDAEDKSWLRTVELSVTHNGRISKMQEPRAIVRQGDRLYVAVHRSGNNSAAGPFTQLGQFGRVIDLDLLPSLSLPDTDVLVLSTEDETLVDEFKGVGTLLYGLHADSDRQRLVVASMDSRNADFLGEGSFPGGRMTLNRLSFIDLEPTPREHLHIRLEDLAAPGGPLQLAMPTDVTMDALNRIYVAAYAAGLVGVFSSEGNFLGAIPTDGGPRGVAVSAERLFVYNRMGSSVTAYNLAGAEPPSQPFLRVELFDPTYDAVRAGRRLFHNAQISGGNSTGCFSCHPDARQDGLSWDLSAYYDEGDGFGPRNPPQFWADRKFAMMTQDCRSLEDTAPYHWRGEKQSLLGFNGAFQNLLKGAPLRPEEFKEIEAYLFNTVFPANPNLGMNRRHSQLAQGGFAGFVGDFGCARCHQLPMASSGAINDRFRINKQQPAEDSLAAANPPQLRGLWTKVSELTDLSDSPARLVAPVTGFGLDHTGSHHSLLQFLSLSFPDLGPVNHARLQAFIDELDTGVAPTANSAYMLRQETVASFPYRLLLAQVTVRNMDLVVHGRIDHGNGWDRVGLVYDPTTSSFLPNDKMAAITMAQLRSLAIEGKAELLFVGVPVGSGERIGVDRDRDGVFDVVELGLGSDPTNPDTDGDGFWDSYDDDPLVPSDTVSITNSPIVTELEVTYTSANSARIIYRTDSFSPTHLVYGTTDSYGLEAGDPIDLPAGSNHWRGWHSLVVQGLSDETLYHFQIRTKGQNQELWSGIDRTFETRSDTFEGVWIESIDLEVVTEGEATRLDTSIRVIDRRGAGAANAELHGIVTLFRDGLPIEQLIIDGGPSDENGVLLGSLDLTVPLAGDELELMVPMYRGPNHDALPGIEPEAGSGQRFAWSESLVTTARVVVP